VGLQAPLALLLLLLLLLRALLATWSLLQAWRQQRQPPCPRPAAHPCPQQPKCQ